MDTPQEVDINLHFEQFVLRILAFLPFSFSEISYFVFFSPLVKAERPRLETMIDCLQSMQPRFQSNIPSRCIHASIFKIWLAPVSFEELAGSRLVVSVADV